MTVNNGLQSFNVDSLINPSKLTELPKPVHNSDLFIRKYEPQYKSAQAIKQNRDFSRSQKSFYLSTNNNNRNPINQTAIIRNQKIRSSTSSKMVNHLSLSTQESKKELGRTRNQSLNFQLKISHHHQNLQNNIESALAMNNYISDSRIDKPILPPGSNHQLYTYQSNTGYSYQNQLDSIKHYQNVLEQIK